ncbi:hypothetical protein AB0K60_35900 [Thermopolyspora sp. NPDC052614]|uniref:hypothetical protein n=1 Tax=Thermopolyspora sp. NPDC052614 TaxID=3155682 RepID=UPI003442C183
MLVMGLMAPPAAAVPSAQVQTDSADEVNPRFYYTIEPSGCRLKLQWWIHVDGRHAVYWAGESYLKEPTARSLTTHSYGYVMEGDHSLQSGDAEDQGRVWSEGRLDDSDGPLYHNAFGWAHSCPDESSQVLATVELQPHLAYPKSFPVTLVYKGTITAGPDAKEPLYRWLRQTGGVFNDVGNYEKGAWERASFPGPDRRLEVTDFKQLTQRGDLGSSGRMLEIDLDGDEETTGDRMLTGWVSGYQ